MTRVSLLPFDARSKPRSALACFLLFCSFLSVLLGSAGLVEGFREFEPVVLTGSELPLFLGEPLDRVFLFSYRPASGWSEVPLQVDERRDSPHPVLGEVYVWSGEEGNGIDANDELVFVSKDALERAPVGEKPAGMGEGYEISVYDPVSDETRYVYVFASSSAQHAPLTPYITFDELAGVCPQNSRGVTDCGKGALVDTPRFSVKFSRRWVLDTFRIKPAGDDLLDRLKYRVYDLFAPGADIGTAESEEAWSVTSEWIGHKSGLVRYIRQVNDAASADNKTYVRTFVYPELIVREHELLVHPLNFLWAYFDFSQQALPVTLYYSGGSVTIDGVPDAFPETPFEHVLEASSSEGSFIIMTAYSGFDQATESNFLNDDASFWDGTGEDNQSLGSVGIKMTGVAPAPWTGSFELKLVPEAGNSPNLVDTFTRYRENPLGVSVSVWNASAPPPACQDSDGDGFNASSCGGLDCDDSDAAINPNGNEHCGSDTVDEDCSGMYCRPGDPYEDLVVNVFDLTLVGSTLGRSVGSATWDAKARRGDTNADGVVDVADLNHVSQYFGTKY
ncbi:hypothetical protein D6783_02535 [Candidatus Woesearchaeota archaeon]|nr:MAG: hypothetical protein D6783_02535 [Candidatus Woesearchaeota archaeon]